MKAEKEYVTYVILFAKSTKMKLLRYECLIYYLTLNQTATSVDLLFSLHAEPSYNISTFGKYLKVCSSLHCKYDVSYLYIHEKEILKSKVKNSAKVSIFM